MQQAQELIAGHAPGPGHRLPGLDKQIGHDGRGRHAALLQQDPVEHTARAAGPSVPDAGDRHVDGRFEFLDRFLIDGRSRRALAAQDVGSWRRTPSPGFRRSGAAARWSCISCFPPGRCAGRAARPGRGASRISCSAFRLVGSKTRIVPIITSFECKFLGGYFFRISFVTLWLERLPLQPGTNAEKAPALPPAATITKSSGDTTSGFIRVSSPGAISPGMTWMRFSSAMGCLGVGETVLPDFFFGPSFLGQDRPVLAGEDQEILGLGTYARGEAQVGAKGRQHPLARVAQVVVPLVGRQRCKDGDRALLRPESPLHVQRRPGAVFLILGEAEGILPRVTDRAAVEGSGKRPDHVAHDEADGPADRRVGPPARSQEVVPRVDVQLAGNRSVDQHEDGRASRAGCGAVVSVSGVGQRLKSGHDDRHVFGPAAGQDRVDRRLLGRDRSPAVSR